MNRRKLRIDWLTVGLYAFFVLFGWINIYAASVKNPEISILNLEYNYGKQFIFVLLAALVGFLILFLDSKFLEFISYFVYGTTLALLCLVLVLARDVNGARAWLEIGTFKLQPAEFAKIGTAMAVARYMARYNFTLARTSNKLVLTALLGAPVGLILLQPDTGSALVFTAFFLMLFREGLSPLVLIFAAFSVVFVVMSLLMNKFIVMGIIVVLVMLVWVFYSRYRSWAMHLVVAALFCGLTLSVDFAMNNVLKPHQQHRIKSLFDTTIDPLGTGWNITQSKIAIGSGGFIGKGFLKGTQTKFEFVPQQDTDFIFCTIGEEYGWLGCTVLLAAFFVFLVRLLYLAENTRTRFGRIYGYSVAAIFFFHVAVNIGMAIGLAPVIGIPLPFFSYGGSSLLSFTVLLFLLLNLYANRNNVLGSDRLS